MNKERDLSKIKKLDQADIRLARIYQENHQTAELSVIREDNGNTENIDLKALNIEQLERDMARQALDTGDQK